MQSRLIKFRKRLRQPLQVLATLALCVTAAQADGPLRYQCTTTLVYGPSRCSGSIAPEQETTVVEIDLERNLWKSDDMVGTVEVANGVFTLKKWGGGMAGRDATIDRASGAFNFHFQSSCLVENQTGSCQPAPAP